MSTQTAICRLCGDTLRRVALEEADEWGWADDTGSVCGLDRDLRNLTPTPYAYLRALAERHPRGMPDDVAAEYHALRVRLELTGAHHVHTPETVPAYVGYVPEHCGWPAMLRPSGWQCRQCGQRLYDGVLGAPSSTPNAGHRDSSARAAA